MRKDYRLVVIGYDSPDIIVCDSYDTFIRTYEWYLQDPKVIIDQVHRAVSETDEAFIEELMRIRFN